jgi:ribokinase
VTTDIVVIGSLNHDLTVVAPRHPQPGETVIGNEHFFGPGGKGANQAVAAARLGARVGMVGRVGDDEQGRSLVDALTAEGVDVSAVSVDPKMATGLALITVDARAENTIVVSPGANMSLSPELIAQSKGLIANAAIVLTQLEVPVETVQAAAEITTGLFCLNPAPARELPAGLLGGIDVLVPNRSELSALAGVTGLASTADVVAAARRLGNRGATVVTLGAGGAVLVDGDAVRIFPSFQVDAIDPTGAGDAFCGAMAFSLSIGSALPEAVRWATAAGAAAATKPGAQAAMPSRDEVEALLGR